MDRTVCNAPSNPMSLLIDARRRAVATVRLMQADVDVIDAIRADLQRDDAAEELVERQSELAMRDAAIAQVEAIDDAIDRLATGQYGRCIECGEAIGSARLDALPWAATCVRHADAVS